MKISWFAPLVLLAALSIQAAETKLESGKDMSKLVCFTEPKTGSHIKKRVCITEAERDARMRKDQDAMTKLRSSSASAGKSGPKQ